MKDFLGKLGLIVVGGLIGAGLLYLIFMFMLMDAFAH